MPTVKSSPRKTRSERAEETRARVARTAYEMFITRGYTATTMAAIAAEAGVAVQTVYFIFRTKAELLQHAYRYAVLGAGSDIPPMEQPWYARMSAADRLDTALDILVTNSGTVLARTARLDEFVRAASAEPDAARVRGFNESLRRDAWSDMVDQLAVRFPLRNGVDRRRATDILLVIMSPTTYQTLVNDYGWSAEDWCAWCIDAIKAQLFRNAPT